MELADALIGASAHRHGIADHDIRPRPTQHHRRRRRSEDEDVTLLLGPDSAANLLEIGVLATDVGPLIIHAMAARTRRFDPPRS